MRNRCFLLTAALVASLIVHAQAKVWTLDDCIEYAISHNIDIRQKGVQIQKQEVALNTSRNEWLPTVSADFAEQLSFANADATSGTTDDLAYTTGSITASINLFDGMKVRNSILADRFSLQAATSDIQNARKQTSIQVAIQYLQCLYQRSIIIEAQEQLALSRQMVKRANIRYEEGQRPLSELKDIEAQAAHDEYTLVNAQGQYTLALTQLSQLLNLPSAEGFDIADIDEESETPPVIYDQAVSSVCCGQVVSSVYCGTAAISSVVDNWPSIIAAKARIESGKANIKVARANLYPTLSLQSHTGTSYLNSLHHDPDWGSFGSQFFHKNWNEVIGLHLYVPIFNRFQTRNKIRAAKLDVLDQELALEDAQQKLRQDIQTAQTNVNVARQKFQAAKKAAEAAAISLSFEQESFDAGRSSVFDLLQARQKHTQARQETIQAKYELIIRQRILKFYLTP